jgi:hypothetical protein
LFLFSPLAVVGECALVSVLRSFYAVTSNPARQVFLVSFIASNPPPLLLFCFALLFLLLMSLFQPAISFHAPWGLKVVLYETFLLPARSALLFLNSSRALASLSHGPVLAVDDVSCELYRLATE